MPKAAERVNRRLDPFTIKLFRNFEIGHARLEVGYVYPNVIGFIGGILEPGVRPKSKVRHDGNCLIGFHMHVLCTER